MRHVRDHRADRRRDPARAADDVVAAADTPLDPAHEARLDTLTHEDRFGDDVR